MTEMVTLVGAGPSGKWLLTLKGAEAIAQAQAVVYDRLVGEDILDLIPPTAERIHVGKENNHHPVPQDEINAILVRCAKAGKRTVRLKGGDNYLFGRGGEECEYLKAHGVPFRVIPGVTSALAAPAFAGIPVTHRDYCSSVHIVTAHARAGKPLDIDFEALLRTRGTLVFLMGLTALEQIADGLLQAGADPDTPAAVIENGTRGSQRKVVRPLAQLPQAVRQAGLGSPALIVVGRVCALADELDWFTPLPLHGRTVVVTRPRARAGTLAGRLRDLGAEVIECPCIQTEELPETAALEAALTGAAYDWVALTSPAGVHAMVHALARCGRDLRALWGCRFAAIGPGTAQELAGYGIQADLVPETYDAAHLGQALAQAAAPGSRVLLLRAQTASPDLPAALDAAGLSYTEAATYRTVYHTEKAGQLRSLLADGHADLVTFTSASTVHAFVQAVGADAGLHGFTALCIGAQTAAAAQQYGMTVKTARQATIDSMIAAALEEYEHV